jgi:hypothetical protein
VAHFYPIRRQLLQVGTFRVTFPALALTVAMLAICGCSDRSERAISATESRSGAGSDPSDSISAIPGPSLRAPATSLGEEVGGGSPASEAGPSQLAGPAMTAPASQAEVNKPSDASDSSSTSGLKALPASVAAENVGEVAKEDAGRDDLQPMPETASSKLAADSEEMEVKSGELNAEQSDNASSAVSENAVSAAPESDNKSLVAAPQDKPRSDTPVTVATEAERNQKIAVDWPKPWAALFLTGQQNGYIEPCGCTGLDNQKGGLNRRDTLLQDIRARGWDTVPLDTGNQVRRSGRQAEMIFRHSADAMASMGYAAIGLGREDLKLSSAELLQVTASEGSQQTAFTSCNVGIIAPDFMSPWKVIPVGSRKIGVTSVLGKSMQEEINNSEIIIEDPIKSVEKALSELKQQKCDVYILLVQANLTESAEIARAVPGFDLIVTGGLGEPTYMPEPIEGSKSLMLQVGVKGMYAGLVGLYDDPSNPIRYQRIALSSQFQDSSRMMVAFRGYQEQLQKEGFRGLEVNPATHPSGRTFVGTESCAECHSTAFEVWKGTPHAHATQSLVHPGERSDIPRHFDPECLSCHVTGWNAKKYYPYESGYLSLEKTPLMAENGCENCHGPGSRHVAAENGDIEADQALLTSLREEMRLPLAQAQDKCLECHDLDNSPNFHRDGAFEEFWEQVKHYGKD